jgi:hypothetical protein
MQGVGRRLAAATAVLVLGLTIATQAPAQSPLREIPDEVARKMLELGLRNIDRAVCGGLDMCAPATPQELEFPPISVDNARGALLAGTRSAYATWCGLDANRRSIVPMMRVLRQKWRFNDRQVALVAVIHGIQMNMVAEQLKARGACDAATRSRLDAELPKS